MYATGRPASLSDPPTPIGILNAATHLIYRLRFRDHITDALISLHWLRVPERIALKSSLFWRTRSYMPYIEARHLTPVHSSASLIPWSKRDAFCWLQPSCATSQSVYGRQSRLLGRHCPTLEQLA